MTKARRHLRLYRVSMRLGLASGPPALIEGDFPHPERMREIAEHDLRQALTTWFAIPLSAVDRRFAQELAVTGRNAVAVVPEFLLGCSA